MISEVTTMRHLLAGLGLFVLAAGGVAPATAQTVSLAGTWKLNTTESDNPNEKLQDALEKRPTVVSGMREGSGRVMRPSPQIIVLQTDTAIVISDEASLPVILYLDGRKVEEPMPGAETMVTTAKWKDAKPTVERKLGGSGSIREVFTMDAAKKRLIVEAKLTSGQLQGTIQIRRVYDAGS